jgi:sulfate permease, SulP family
MAYCCCHLDSHARFIRKPVFMLSWLSNYRREALRADSVAGLTTAAVVIPKAMACAVIAGLPVEAGLYTALAAMLSYPLFGTSRVLSVSSTSAIAMLAASALIADATRETGANPVVIAATLAFMVGAILVLARLLRLGFLANFISKPVLVGFTAGVGVVIIIGQLKSMLGVSVASHNTLGILRELTTQLGNVHGLTMLVGAIGILLLVGMHRMHSKLPAPLVWVVLAITASMLFGLGERGLKLIGEVPAGLPMLALPAWSLMPALLPAALGIALMSFTESIAAARTFWRSDDQPIKPNQELFSIGVANIAASLIGGMPAGGGTSQTAVAEQAGARSQMAQWIGALAVLLTLLLLSRLIGFLPEVALAALVIVVSAGMVKLSEFKAIAQVKRAEWAWAVVTFAGVLLIGTLEGILIAVVVSMLTLLYQANHPPVYELAYNKSKDVFRRIGEHSSDVTFDGLLMLRTEGRLTFANAANIEAKMHELVEQTKARVIVLECSAIPDIEYTALLMLIEAEKKLRERGVSLCLVALNPDLLKTIERSPLGSTLGHSRMFISLPLAVKAFERNNTYAA